MTPPKKLRPGEGVHYVDRDGRRRFITFVEDVPWLVPWGAGASTARRWRLEGGYVAQIPDAAWELVRGEEVAATAGIEPGALI